MSYKKKVDIRSSCSILAFLTVTNQPFTFDIRFCDLWIIFSSPIRSSVTSPSWIRSNGAQHYDEPKSSTTVPPRKSTSYLCRCNGLSKLLCWAETSMYSLPYTILPVHLGIKATGVDRSKVHVGFQIVFLKANLEQH